MVILTNREIYISRNDNRIVRFDHYSYMMFGIFALILTPVLRILGLLVVYIKEKDYKFVRICIIVLLKFCVLV